MMEKQLQELEGKFRTLEFTRNKTAQLMTSDNIDAISRQEDSIRSKIKAIHTLKESIIEHKFTVEESEEVVESDKKEMVSNQAKHEEKLKQERELLEQQLEYLKTKEASHQVQTTNAAAKLPKLSITQFDGLFEEWLPFWNKFKAEIDSATLTPVTKFAYLKELVEPKVRADIDRLPLNSEGYERAKSILKGEYGKTSEIVNAYVRNILELPVVTSPDPKRVNDFYMQDPVAQRTIAGNSGQTRASEWDGKERSRQT